MIILTDFQQARRGAIEYELGVKKQLLAEEEEFTKSLQTDILQLRRELVALMCPHRVGQRVTRKDGKVFEISRIEPTRFGWGRETGYDIFGRLVLANGKVSKLKETQLWYLSV